MTECSPGTGPRFADVTPDCCFPPRTAPFGRSSTVSLACPRAASRRRSNSNAFYPQPPPTSTRDPQHHHRCYLHIHSGAPVLATVHDSAPNSPYSPPAPAAPAAPASSAPRLLTLPTEPIESRRDAFAASPPPSSPPRSCQKHHAAVHNGQRQIHAADRTLSLLAAPRSPLSTPPMAHLLRKQPWKSIQFNSIN
jgi:hypothetical protein